MKVNKIQIINTIMKSVPESKIQELIFNDPVLPYQEKYILNIAEWEQENKDKSKNGENIDLEV